ncbi:hypothetical protein CPB83DRAFT_858786 [Crepidotus variabilis]|uniref:Uncharacterized protein n=1 Tax=Crepidotus variabilis TaxID=179855 RepID=A0A9P6EBF2_9AGAR|nr:hypothetical protein CPB83DRAFT_858786 [Crepidotus variabilis]
MLKRLHLERIERFNFNKVSPVSPNNKDSPSLGKGKKSRTYKSERSSEEKGSPDVKAQNSQKKVETELQITHLKLLHCSHSLNNLSLWLTHSSLGSDNKISGLRSLHFHSREMSDYATLPKILEACKATLEEFEVDLGKDDLFGLTRNLLPTTAKPPGFSQSVVHLSSSQSTTLSSLSYNTSSPPGPFNFSPPPLPLPATQAMLQMFPNAILQPNTPAPATPITVTSAIPLSSLPKLRSLKIHTSISSHSQHMTTSQGAEITMTMKYTSAMKQIGEMLQAGWALSEALKEVELRVRFRMKGTNAPRLKDVDFSSISCAFDHLGAFTNSKSSLHALASKKDLEGPLVTLAIHPAFFSPSSSGIPERRIPFAELISDISNNKDLMDMVRSGRVVVKGKVLERAASVGSSIFGVMQGRDEEKDRIWKGEVGWGR